MNTAPKIIGRCCTCHAGITENDSLTLCGAAVYHKRCAPAAAAAPADLAVKGLQVLFLAAPALFVTLLLVLFFPIPFLCLVLAAPFAGGWLLLARKIQRDRRR